MKTLRECQYTVQEMMVSPTHVSSHQLKGLSVAGKVVTGPFLYLHPGRNPKLKTTILSDGKDFSAAAGKNS